MPAAFLMLVFLLPIVAQAKPKSFEASTEIDPSSGLVVDSDWRLVQVTCVGCHSTRIITGYGATREKWAALINWMQEKQGLWEINPESEDKILTYLAKHYPPTEVSRRRNLPAPLRPPNPYIRQMKGPLEQPEGEGHSSKPSGPAP